MLAVTGATAGAEERIVETTGPLGPLRGALIRPDDAQGPIVLIIPGSGPTDRDGNSRLGLAANTYRLIAEGLAARGIASVRIDKRGMHGSASAIADPNAVIIADYAADVRGWVRTLRAEHGASCVVLLGHSEGGLVALAAAQHAEGLCGLVLAASPGRRLGDILREQLAANPANAPVLDEANAAISTLEAGGAVEPARLHPGLRPLFGAQVQGFLRDAMSHDPAALAATIRLPVLVLQGGRDLQVSVADARRLAAAAPAGELALIPDANHVLKSAPEDRAANLATYANPALPLAGGVVERIAAFIAGLRAGR